MNAPAPWLYVAIFGGSLAIVWWCTPLALRLALAKGIVDSPGGHKRQARPVPVLGGLVMVVAFALALMVAALLAPERTPLDELGAILLTAVGLAVVGFADDLWNLHPLLRLLVESSGALAVWAVGARVDLLPGDGLDLLLTVLWVVGVANAFNLLDNMDGLSGGVAAVASGGFFLIAVLHGQFLVAALAAALAGCSLGFLRHNHYPARIYMGDAGSLFIGFLLAVIGMKLRFPGPSNVTFFVPILVLGVALFDTTLVTVTRLAHGRSPLSGGRDHVSHRLVFVGLSVPVAVALIYAGAVALVWLAVLMSMLEEGAAYVLMGFVLAVALFLAMLIGRVPVYENSKRRHVMLREIAPHELEAEQP